MGRIVHQYNTTSELAINDLRICQCGFNREWLQIQKNSIQYFCRETLLGQLSVYIKSLRDDFVKRTSGGGSKGPPKGKNLPEVVNNIVYVKQLEAKVCSLYVETHE